MVDLAEAREGRLRRLPEYATRTFRRQPTAAPEVLRNDRESTGCDVITPRLFLPGGASALVASIESGRAAPARRSA